MALTVLSFLVVLAALVLVHEAGHALVARAAGCRVEEFGIGFPPRLFGTRIGETLFSLNLIPLGGFVRITGEDGGAAEDPRSFARRSRGVKIAILLAGVAMNILLSVALFTVVAGVGSDVPAEGVPASVPVTDRRIEIVDVAETPVLRRAGILAGDVLIEVESVAVEDAAAAAERILGFAGDTLSLTLRRGEETVPARVQFDGPHVVGEPLGLALLDVGTYRVPWWRAPAEGVRSTLRTVRVTAVGLGSFFQRLFVSRSVPGDVAGPVGIAAIVGSVARQGILPLIELTAILSVNLALINALPIPALDGGRVLFVFLDALGVRTASGHPERLAHAIGFILLIALILLITLSDVRRLFTS